MVVPVVNATHNGYEATNHEHSLFGLSTTGDLYKWDRKWVEHTVTDKDGDTVDGGEYIYGWKLLVDELNK